MSGLREEVFRSPSHAMALSHSSSAQSPSPAATLVVSPYTHTHSWSLPRSWSLSFSFTLLLAVTSRFLSLAHTRCLSHSLRLSLSLSLIHFSDPPPARLRWLSLTLPSSPSLAVSPSLDCLSHNRSLPLLSLLLSHTHFSIAPLTRSMSHRFIHSLTPYLSSPLRLHCYSSFSPSSNLSLSPSQAISLSHSTSSLSFVVSLIRCCLSHCLVVSLTRCLSLTHSWCLSLPHSLSLSLFLSAASPLTLAPSLSHR